MTIQAILSTVLVGTTAAFGYLNVKTYIIDAQKKENPEQIVEKRKNIIVQKKYENLIEIEKKQLVIYKTLLNTQEIPNPVPVMVRKENLLEEKPAPMPAWVATMRQDDPNYLYFIGTRTKAADLKTAFEDAKKLSFEELFKYIGVKMDYEMRMEKKSSEDENAEDTEKMFRDVQTQILGKFPEISKIVDEKGRYYRKIKESDGIFYEAHVLIACNIEQLKKVIGESVDTLMYELTQKTQMSAEERKNKEALFGIIKAKRDQVVAMSEKEKQIYDLKRKQYETIERQKNMTDLSYQLFLGEKSLFFGKKEEAIRYLKTAEKGFAQKAKEMEEILETEENFNDSLETRVIKRLKKSNLYFKKGNPIAGYQSVINALEALLMDYDNMKNSGKLGPYISQIDQKLMEHMKEIPKKMFVSYTIEGNKVIFHGEGRGGIAAHFNPAGQLLCSLVREDEGHVYSFYSGDRIIYKMVQMNNKENARSYGLYDQYNRFVKEIK